MQGRRDQFLYSTNCWGHLQLVGMSVSVDFENMDWKYSFKTVCLWICVYPFVCFCLCPLFLCKLNGWCGWVWHVVYLWVRMTTLLQVTMKILTTLHLNISDTSSPSQLSRCSLSWRCMFRRITRHLWAENNSLSLFRDQDITFQWQRETSLVRNARTNEISCYRCGSGMAWGCVNFEKCSYFIELLLVTSAFLLSADHQKHIFE